MSYSLDPISDNCYSGTAVLINKLDIRDEPTLREIEATVVSAKAALWERQPLQATFDFAHYKAVHRFLFEDLYDWAGQIRTVNISKKGTRFYPFEEIKTQAALIFEYIHRQKCFASLDHKDFVSEITDFYCSINNLHPFREGNGRTQRVFITQLIRQAGYDIDFADIDGELLMIATIQSVGGVADLLKRLFTEAIYK